MGGYLYVTIIITHVIHISTTEIISEYNLDEFAVLKESILNFKNVNI